MFGLPDCGAIGCPWPGFIKFSFTDDLGEVFVHICPLCIPRAPELLRSIADARRQMHLEHEAAHAEEETGPVHRLKG